MDQLQNRVKTLQTKFLKNEKDAQDVQENANSMTEEVQQAKNQASEMQSKYNLALDDLNQRAQDSHMEQARAQNLLKKASQLSSDTRTKLVQLKGCYTNT